MTFIMLLLGYRRIRAVVYFDSGRREVFFSGWGSRKEVSKEKGVIENGVKTMLKENRSGFFRLNQSIINISKISAVEFSIG